MSDKRSPALGFIFVTILIDVIGLGIIIPVVPKLIQQLTGEGLSRASEYSGWLTFAYAMAQFCCAPVIGGLSDKLGRRPVLLAALLGLGLDYIFLSFAPTLAWLFVGRVIAGITGASFTTATAYIADISTPEKRAQNFGLVGAAFGIGFIIGPAVGGLLADFGSRVPFMVAAGLSLCNFFYGFFVLPESLAPAKRRPFEWRRANPVASLLRLGHYPAVLGLVAALVLIYLAGSATQSVWTFYTMLKFGWTEKLVGISLAVIGLFSGLVQGGLVRVAIPRLGAARAIVVGLLCYALGFVLFAFASRGWLMLVFLAPYCLGGISGPALQGTISGQVPANEQGELQGSLTSLISATGVVGPLMMTYLFAFFTRPTAPVQFPGAPFLLGAVLALASVGLAVRSLRKHPPVEASAPPAEAIPAH
ncbi:TCR/Tet family MFS transporter [Hymenobacter sp. BT770]|uniref:TCR/Tet family MFS transporter n=1 Tax=Hymenobacter sp. BT770 TaxID=2886942 RepID=UPI001D0FE32E|nr:TCR/Tet family MFS transporter [Hymenobacter sp. BT770]MCC3154214.1 TCR/Tet family MFS transporter [Hymenobacter sp. BT770]MDO3414339.1 TCR/Tet family MFS transporter [Hymenobacter sp. BT770]